MAKGQRGNGAHRRVVDPSAGFTAGHQRNGLVVAIEIKTAGAIDSHRVSKRQAGSGETDRPIAGKLDGDASINSG